MRLDCIPPNCRRRVASLPPRRRAVCPPYNATVLERAGRLGVQYVVVAVTFSVLLLGSFALFFHLLQDQMSRGYLEDVLLSGKLQAAEVARELSAGEGPLYRVVETRREALARISAALAQKEVVDHVQVYDERGRLVWATTVRTEGFSGGFPDSNLELLVLPEPEQVVETSREYQIRMPLQDIGTVVVTLSKPVLEQRIAVLRRRLLTHTAMAGGSALLLLVAAVAFIWHLVRRNARLEQKRRLQEDLAALGGLAANLAHEIRNPLNALSLNLEMLEEDLSAGAAGGEAVQVARREVGRLSRLVNDFLVYARPSPPAREPVAVSDLLGEVGSLLAGACEKAGVELRVEPSGGEALADRAQLTQVLVNLALNSVQAMEGSATRRLTLSGGPDGEGDTVAITIADTGPGIPQEELGRVREAFYSRRKGGTGLGLAIADRIVAAHGGSLHLENREEGGLMARVVLPSPSHQSGVHSRAGGA